MIVTDPPFNIGYHYKSYRDKMKEEKYYSMLKEVFTMYEIPFVCVHYPEQLYKLAIYIYIYIYIRNVLFHGYITRTQENSIGI